MVSLGWQRINPRVVFDPELFVAPHPSDRGMDVVYDALAANTQNNQYWGPLDLTNGETYARILHRLFEPWTVSNHLWEE